MILGGLNPCQYGLGYFFRNEVPQSARLNAGELVQLLFGQCLNRSGINLRGASQKSSKGGWGGGQTHVQKFWSKCCMILKAFWQHKIDIIRLFKGRKCLKLGVKCLNIRVNLS